MRTVLILEPDAADARALKAALKEAGLPETPRVLQNTGQLKRHVSKSGPGTILFLNVHANNGDGMEFLGWLRTQPVGHRPLIIVVGERGQLRDVVKACEQGASTFLIKPVHSEDLKSLARTYDEHWKGVANDSE